MRLNEAVFAGLSTALYSNSTWTGSSPSNHSYHQKTLGYRWCRLHPSVFSHFDAIPEYDGQTDRQTNTFAAAYTVLVKLGL